MNIITNKLSKFLDSFWFLVSVAAVTFISFVANIAYLSFYILLIVLALILISKRSFKSVISLIILLYANHRMFKKFDFNNPLFIGLLVLLGIVSLIFIYNIITKQYHFERLKKDFIFYSMLLILLSMIVSLINTPVIKDSLVGILYWILIVLSYVLVRISVDFNQNDKEYIIKSILVSGLLISFEVIFIIFLNMSKGMSFFTIFSNKELNLGWANINHIAAFLDIVMILAFYYIMNCKKILNRIMTLTAVGIYLFIVVLSGCRGAYLSLAIIIPFVIVYYIFYQIKVENSFRKHLIYFACALMIVSIVFVTFNLFGYTQTIIDVLIKRGFKSTGRNYVYQFAIEHFKEHPIIGPGVYTSWYYLNMRGVHVYNYHNYYLQMLGTCGIFGAIAFTIYLVFSIKRAFSKDMFSICTLIVIAYFLIHGALDTLYFNSYIMPLQCVLLASIEGCKRVNFKNNLGS